MQQRGPCGSGAVGRARSPCQASLHLRECGVRAGVQAAAEVRLPPAADFAGGVPAGSLRRLLVLDGVQDPGNMVGRLPLQPRPASPRWRAES